MQLCTFVFNLRILRLYHNINHQLMCSKSSTLTNLPLKPKIRHVLENMRRTYKISPLLPAVELYPYFAINP